MIFNFLKVYLGDSNSSLTVPLDQSLREKDIERERDKQRQRQTETDTDRERKISIYLCICPPVIQVVLRETDRLNMIFYFLKVYLGDSNRQPQSSRENLEWSKGKRLRETEKDRQNRQRFTEKRERDKCLFSFLLMIYFKRIKNDEVGTD